jgi:hypothetical protein
MTQSAEVLPGTLDLLALKAVSVSSWNRLADAVALALRATPQEV